MTDAGPWLHGGGFLVGLAFGAIVQRQRFCMVAAVGNFVIMRDWRHIHAFLAAFAVAIAGTLWLEAGGFVRVAESVYRSPSFDWLGASAGGLLFGFGATLAGGCAARTLVRAAEGSLGAWIALLTFALAAAITQFGILSTPRMTISDLTAVTLSSGDSSLATLLGISPGVAGILAAIACIGMLTTVGRGTHDRHLIAGGAMIGALVVAAWWITGNLARDEFSVVPPSALNISGPLARMMHYPMAGNGTEIGFGIPFVLGTTAGAAASALLRGTFGWQAPEARYIPNYLVGGAMMGVGAITAGGCNIGQGLSGVSTLAAGSLIAASAIFAGAILGVKWLERRT